MEGEAFVETPIEGEKQGERERERARFHKRAPKLLDKARLKLQLQQVDSEMNCRIVIVENLSFSLLFAYYQHERHLHQRN